MFGLCCCGPAASCNAGTKPEKAYWELTMGEIVRDRPGPRVSYLHPGGAVGAVGIVVPASEDCFHGGPPPDPPTQSGQPNVIPHVTGNPTYRCANLGTGSKPRKLHHQSTLELDDGSKRWTYFGTWKRTFAWPDIPHALFGNSIAMPIPYAVETWVHTASFWVFEKLQPANDWRDIYPCLEKDDEWMHRCLLFLQLNGTISQAAPPGDGAGNWHHEPRIQFHAQMTIYRGHDGKWYGCPITGCCQWYPPAGGAFRLRRVDPPESVAKLSAVAKAEIETQ